MKLTRIDILSIPVSDQTVSKLFYTEKLGFEVIHDMPMGPQGRWIQLGLPGAATSISLVTGFDAMSPGGMQGTVLATDDIEGMHEVLSGHGILMSELQSAPWGRYSTFHDPDMNGWVVVQSPGAPGAHSTAAK